MPTILVIDDNRAVSTALEVLFSLHDIDTLHAESPDAGLALLREQPVDLVIQDMNFTQDTTSGAEGERLGLEYVQRVARETQNEAASRELDVLAATGEQVTIALLAMALIKRGYPAVSLLADQICIHTDNKFGKARITAVDNQRLLQELEQGHIVVAAGFQGRDFEGNVTTLGRGGSDTSAVAVAAAVLERQWRWQRQ